MHASSRSLPEHHGLFGSSLHFFQGILRSDLHANYAGDPRDFYCV